MEDLKSWKEIEELLDKNKIYSAMPGGEYSDEDWGNYRKTYQAFKEFVTEKLGDNIQVSIQRYPTSSYDFIRKFSDEEIGLKEWSSDLGVCYMCFEVVEKDGWGIGYFYLSEYSPIFMTIEPAEFPG